MPEKIPPHNVDAEEAVVGSLLIDGSAIEHIANHLDPQSFYYERTKWVYEIALSLYQRGEAINQVTVSHELQNRGKLEACGGVAYLSYLVSMCPTSLDIEHYADIVWRTAMARKLIAAGEQIMYMGYQADHNIDEALEQAHVILDGIKSPRSRRLEVSNLRIIKSNPRHYILEVNGRDLRFSRTELLQKAKFKAKIIDELDFVPILPKNWDNFISGLLSNAKELEAPVDTSPDIEVKLSTKRWFEQRGEGEEYSDIQSGSYVVVPYRGKETNWEQREFWAFQPTPLLRWLKRDLGKVITRDALWSMVVSWGGVKWQWRVGKGNSVPIRLWALPPSFAEDAEFAVEKEEKQVEMEIPQEEAEEEELPDI
jgi:hypothetical protein